jgi:hypothetical protein
VARQTLRGFGSCESEYNFCDMARTCSFSELAVAKKSTYYNFCVMCLLAVFVPHRSNKYFHVIASKRNCFEFALYIMTHFQPHRFAYSNYPRRRYRYVTFGALPTLSVRDRAIIVLNDHRFWGWGYASGPSPSGNKLPSSIHGHAARRSALPRERFSPLALFGNGGVACRRPFPKEHRTPVLAEIP